MHSSRSALREPAAKKTPPDRLQSDPALLKRYRAGDPEAVQVVIDHYLPIAVGAIRKVLSSPHDAEDVLQDTIVLLLEKRDAYKGTGAFGGFVWRVASRRALDRRRREKRRSAIPFQDRLPEAAGPPAEEQYLEEGERQWQERELAELLGSLSPEEHEMLDLHHGHGMGRDSMAEAFDISPKAARYRMKRLAEKIARWFKGRETR